jgi:hypothetical protein
MILLKICDNNHLFKVNVFIFKTFLAWKSIKREISQKVIYFFANKSVFFCDCSEYNQFVVKNNFFRTVATLWNFLQISVESGKLLLLP